VVTTHLYDGKKSLALDIELYQHASSLPQGKKDIEFKKKPELALTLTFLAGSPQVKERNLGMEARAGSSYQSGESCCLMYFFNTSSDTPPLEFTKYELDQKTGFQ